MLRPRPVTTLAIDALRQIAGKYRIAAGSVMARRNFRYGIVTEDAFVGREAPRLRMDRIESRAHAPISVFLRIPAERQLYIAAVGHPMQIRPRVVAGTDRIVDLHLFDVGFL